MKLGHSIEDGNRTQDVINSQCANFDSLLLAPNTLLGLKKCGFHKPSPIQLHGIPLGKCGFDLLLEAKSGTGKSAVFTVISLEKIDLNKGLQAVILAPTREIAAQICDVIKQIGTCYTGLKVDVVMGGLPIEDDIQKIQNRAHILVASPGRLRHLIQNKHIDVSAVRMFVLDEADKLLEKSFLADINYIFSVLPKEKQVIMSSATYPEKTKSFIMNYVQNAQHVCPDSNSILLGIKQTVTFVKQNINIVKQTKYRFEELLKILSKHSFKQCLIFCNYQARIAELHKMLKKEKWPAQQLYGQQEQLERLNALKSLQQYKCRILIATDLAARGIDASNVDMVINFEPPHDWQTYLHRIGRAGRFGSYGIAITILSEGSETKKFITTLEAIKAPMNIENLWSNEQFITSKNTEVESKEKPIEPIEKLPMLPPLSISPICKNYQKLWDCLTKNSNNHFEFDGSSIARPETFAELITSFENLDTAVDSQENNLFSRLPMPEMPIGNYLNIIDKTISELSTCKESEITVDTNTIDSQASDSVTCNGNNRTQFDEDCTILKYESSHNHIESKSDSINNHYQSDEYYIPNIEDELVKAGLPTMFASAKLKNNHERFAMSKPIDYKNLEKTHQTKSTKTSSSYCTKWRGQEKESHETITKTTTMPIKSYGLTKSLTKIKSEVNSLNFQKATFKNQEKYQNWFYDLKLKVKQIELALYVDEMTKQQII